MESSRAQMGPAKYMEIPPMRLANSRAHLVWNHHDRKERDQRREQHAVDEDHKPGFFQVLELWVFDFRLTCASVSSPLMASTECPKPTNMRIQVR